jgi:hypothetical protein
VTAVLRYWDAGTSAWVELTGPGPGGPPGATGDTGATGPPGATGQAEAWHSSTGAPAGALGALGDWHLDTTSGDVSEKTGASAWTVRGNIRGPTGSTGTAGAPGTPGVGVPAGGATGTVLTKTSATDYATAWQAAAGGGTTEVNISTAGPSPRVAELLWVDTDDAGPSVVGQRWSPEYLVDSGSMPSGTESAALTVVHSHGAPGIIVGHIEDGVWAHQCGWRMNTNTATSVSIKFLNPGPVAAQALLRFRMLY